jgi:ADP-ribosylglycohydrolase
MLKEFIQWYNLNIEENINLSKDYKHAFEDKDDRIPLTQHYQDTIEVRNSSETNECLLRMAPIALWGQNLDPDSLFALVKLVVMMTHSHELVVESCYLYCFAI